MKRYLRNPRVGIEINDSGRVVVSIERAAIGKDAGKDSPIRVPIKLSPREGSPGEKQLKDLLIFEALKTKEGSTHDLPRDLSVSNKPMTMTLTTVGFVQVEKTSEPVLAVAITIRQDGQRFAVGSGQYLIYPQAKRIYAPPSMMVFAPPSVSDRYAAMIDEVAAVLYRLFPELDDFMNMGADTPERARLSAIHTFVPIDGYDDDGGTNGFRVDSVRRDPDDLNAYLLQTISVPGAAILFSVNPHRKVMTLKEGDEVVARAIVDTLVRRTPEMQNFVISVPTRPQVTKPASGISLLQAQIDLMPAPVFRLDGDLTQQDMNTLLQLQMKYLNANKSIGLTLSNFPQKFAVIGGVQEDTLRELLSEHITISSS